MTCTCGHEHDEHEDTFFEPCAIEDCDCAAYEEDEEDEE